MNKVAQLFVCTILVISLMFPSPAKAGPAEDFQEARLIYLTAVASMAAYPDKGGDILLGAMGHNGWTVEPYTQKDANAQARFLLAKNVSPEGSTEFVLAIAGSHTAKDWELNIKTGKVYYDEKTPDISDQAPKIHKGFNQYVQAAMEAETRPTVGGKPGQKLVDLLLEHSEQRVYLSGHSLGGAAATLLGARLVSAGVKPEQLKIITFGAPAVGNAAFADYFDSKLELTRIVIAGDPIPDALQRVAGGYRQFGQEIRWNVSGYTIDEKHNANLYLDHAIKHYYDKQMAAVQAGVADAASRAETPVKNGKRFYVAQINNHLPKELRAEFSYMREVLFDAYRDHVEAYTIGDPIINARMSFEGLRAKATVAGCDRMVITNIWAKKPNYGDSMSSRPDDTFYVVVIEQAVFRVSDGALLDGRTYQKGSKYFTPCGALLSAADALGDDSAIWSGQ